MREEVESLKLIKEEEWSRREFKLLSIVSVKIEGGDEAVVMGKVVVSFKTSA